MSPLRPPGPLPSPPAWAGRLLAPLAVLLFVLLQLAAVHNPRVVEVDPEEMFNAGQAWLLVQGHAADLFRLQYRPFCGGCTLDAVLGAPLFALFGPRWPVWKLVPIGLAALLLGVGSRLLQRRENTVAAGIFALCFLLPPRAWLHLSLVAWGNHMEAGLVGTLGLLLLWAADGRRWAVLGAGAVLGMAVWVGFSGAFAPLAGLAWLARFGPRRALPWLGAGLALGVSPWLAQWLATGEHPFVTIYEPGEAAPSLARVPHKLATLLAPRQLVALFGLPDGGLGWALGWGWAASLAAALGLGLRARAPGAGRVAALGLGAWTAIYLVVRFQVYDPPPPQIAVPGSARYAAPLYPLAFVVLATAAGRLHRAGRRGWALLVLPVLLAGAAARLETLRAPFPAAGLWQLHAVDWRYFQNQFAYVLPLTDHAAGAASGEAHTRRAHAYALGREGAALLLRTQGSLAGLAPVAPGPPLDAPLSPTAAQWEGIGDAMAAHLQDRSQGSLDLLAQTQAALEAHLSPSPAALQRALRAAAAWRLAPENSAGDSWLRAIDRHDDGSLAAGATALRGEPAALQDAVWWATGRRWATDAVGVGMPGSLPLPAPPSPPGVLAPAFCAGLGQGLGEEWGPAAADHAPAGMDAPCAAAWAAGVAAGWPLRWLGAPALRP